MSSSILILSKRIEYFIWEMRNHPLAEPHVSEVGLDAMEVNENYDLAFCSSEKQKKGPLLFVLAAWLCCYALR